MRLFDIVKEGGVIDMMSLAKRAKALLAKGMSEQQAQDALVKEGVPARLAAQAVQMAQMSETVADQLTDQQHIPKDYQTGELLKQGPDGKWRNRKGEERDGLYGAPIGGIPGVGKPRGMMGGSKPTRETVAGQPTLEAPIASTDDPMDPMIHSHNKANPMTLKGRILQTRKQLQELAQMAERDDLATWMQITKLAKGGMFMGLEQNLEQVRHGLEELAAKRKKGGVQSRGIEKFMEDPSAGSTSSAHVGVGAVYKNKAGKTPKNKDGTAKNALDMKANLLTGGSIAKR